jgi:hypothetical protein
MRRNLIPSEVQAKLDKLERQVAHWTQQVSKNQDAIADARDRLTGGFQKGEEYRDWRAALDKLIADKPIFEAKLDDAQFTLAECNAFLANLPDDATLQQSARVKPNGADLATVRRRITDAEDEIARLTALPTPAPDIKERIEQYVAALARPQVTGTGAGQTLRVEWPDDVVSVLALLLPSEMTNALLKAVERQCSTPPLAERRKRIAQLRAKVDTLQRQALALGDSSGELPPEVILGVVVASQGAAA